jgi:2,5-diketo-D-gluconate reductase B
MSASIPNIGVGTFRLSDEQVRSSLATALELGYRHIDSAQIYGTEAAVGQALREAALPRDELFVTTKVWTEDLGRDRLVDSLRRSLDRLQLDRVDLCLIHWPSPGDAVPVAESMAALAEAQEQGLTRLIGVSNFTIGHLQAAIEAIGAARIATQQIEVHPFLQNRAVVDYCRTQGIHLTAYMPLAYGKAVQHPVLREIAARHNATPAQVALAWLLEQGMAVIPSSTRREHLAANLGAVQLRLDADDRRKIAALEAGERIADPDFAPHWD